MKEILMSRRNVWSVLLILIGWASLAVPASAQHFQQVNGTLTSVSAGRNEVFGFDTHARVWRLNPKTNSFDKIKNVLLDDIAVGGGTVYQLDEVWGIDASLNVYRFNYTTKAFDQIPGAALSQITVGLGNEDQCHPYEVWGVSAIQEVFRYDYCSNQFNQSPGSFLTQIATGGGDVWGIITGQIYHYSFGQEKFVQIPGTLTQIAVGVNDVWGVNGSNNDYNVYRYDPAGGVFNRIGGSTAQVAAGGDGVWIIDTSDNVWRFDSSAESFLQVTGALNSIAVGSGTGVFGVSSSDQVFTFVRP
ncbi:MAG: tectonin domain-containing protein [Steroidobacteraceae bacterium]|jgi:hypothetical protein